MMYLKEIFVFLLLVEVSFQSHGINVQVHDRGLNYLKEIGLNILQKKAQNAKIPDHGSQGVTVYNMRIVSYSLGSPSVRTRYTGTLQTDITGASFRVTGRWRYEKKFLFFTFRDSGSFSATASGVDFHLAVLFGRSGDRPTISPSSRCDASISRLRVDIGDNFISFVYNFILEIFNGSLKKYISDQICPSFKKAIQSQSSPLSSKFPLELPLFLSTSINIGLTRTPFVSGNAINVFMRGKCYPTSNRDLTIPFGPTSLPSVPIDSKMLQITASNYVTDTLLYSLYNQNVFKQSFSSRSMGSLPAVLGDTGRLATSFLKSPGAPELTFTVMATSSPRTEFITDRIKLTAYISFIVTKTRPTTELLRVDTRVTAYSSARLVGDRLYGSITNLTANVINSTSVRGPINSSVINGIVANVIPAFVRPKINIVISPGFKIPKLLGFSARRPSLAIKKNAIELTTDVTFAP